MVRRHSKKKNYLRGMRRHGRGNIKNRRGSGNRGGRGLAGMKKHKWTRTVKYAKDHFGSRGFVRPSKKKVLPTVNLWEINAMASKGELKSEGDVFVFEFKGKLLGTGKVTVPVKVRALSASQKAQDKLKEAGGSFEQIEV